MGLGNFARISLLAFAVLLAACGNNVSENKKQSENSCSEVIIAAANDVGKNSKIFDRHRTTRSAQALKASCNTLYSLLGAGTCKAQMTETGEKVDLSWSVAEPACGRADRHLSTRQSRREQQTQRGPLLPSKPFNESEDLER